ncbi:hypothetical protein ElyMa_005574000 [Elysia marginata]|uniref:Uncharacterized protein n=1 Tax=Elysia marginata TaxID=1093978 RepID=A0AAV4F2Z2_9GAST|nr:hypothetical protein ElyMa_005574000 [Elysia marginata]
MWFLRRIRPCHAERKIRTSHSNRKSLMEKEAGENKGKSDGWTKALAGIRKFDRDNDSYGTSGVVEKHDRRRFKACHWMMMMYKMASQNSLYP